MRLQRWLASIGEIVGTEHVQTLWSGYGEIVRVRFADGRALIVKRVEPAGGTHPRGWDGDRSHARKLRSYEVESAFYARWAPRCSARVPRAERLEQTDDGWLLLLEDLDASGYRGRRNTPDDSELDACLTWLARFHACFLRLEPEGLWPVGTYWHLDTRPDELEATDDRELREAAPQLDRILNECTFQTFVHGDAKVANFCFGSNDVAAVDFQYVGGGCGMKDIAYFFSSCLSDGECERRAPSLLDRYFELLRSALPDDVDADALETEWRGLYPAAWADFHRFLAGWAPGHWKIHEYTRRMTRVALADL